MKELKWEIAKAQLELMILQEEIRNAKYMET